VTRARLSWPSRQVLSAS